MDLKNKILSREAKIGVIGLGYVGLPLIIEFVKAGFEVTGFDVDKSKVDFLRAGKSYIKQISEDSIKEILPKFDPATEFSKLADMDAIVICVPTPLNKNREPDMSYVFGTTRTIAKYLRKGQLISLESTTYPGTTDEDVRAILEEGGLKAGTDFYLAFSPEREDPNNNDFRTRTIPKVVGGFNPASLEVAKALYDQIVQRTDQELIMLNENLNLLQTLLVSDVD
jgi:UDP-N-acetyl-D-glucosamine dehydrogenase